MTTKAQEPTRYRVSGGHWKCVQLAIPEGVGVVGAIFHGGDVLPTWATAENIDHLLAVNAIEKVEASS